jgi:hypothetical protein
MLALCVSVTDALGSDLNLEVAWALGFYGYAATNLDVQYHP